MFKIDIKSRYHISGISLNNSKLEGIMDWDFRPVHYQRKVILPPKHYTFNWNLLPSTLTHLTFGINFNLPVDKKLPHSLTHLKFKNNIWGTGFNQPIDHLPPRLTHLVVGTNFNKPVNNLPSTLKYFKAGEKFDHSIDNLPDAVTHIILHNIPPINKLPPSLLYLRISYTPDIPNLLLRNKKGSKVQQVCKVQGFIEQWK